MTKFGKFGSSPELILFAKTSDFLISVMSSDCQTVLDKIANSPNFSHVKLLLFMVAMYIVNFYVDNSC